MNGWLPNATEALSAGGIFIALNTWSYMVPMVRVREATWYLAAWGGRGGCPDDPVRNLKPLSKGCLDELKVPQTCTTLHGSNLSLPIIPPRQIHPLVPSPLVTAGKHSGSELRCQHMCGQCAGLRGRAGRPAGGDRWPRVRRGRGGCFSVGGVSLWEEHGRLT
jgi:hypothetical protein